MKYIRTKNGRIGIYLNKQIGNCHRIKFKETIETIYDSEIIKQADTIEELCDEFVIIENGHTKNVVYLPEAKDRLLEYHEMGNYEPRLIGRIKVGLDIKAIAEFEELTEGKYKGCYDWVLL